ncbi:MAG: hypothetical protein JSW71_01610 [Gemmatimonadota bacterium]|nr:MAG: hypothetical protein JSW71_01610 [Gemmatimonadota bacterium]
MLRGLGIGFVAAGGLLAVACGANRGDSDAPECTSMERNLTAGTQAETLVGEYRLVLVASSGAESSHTVAGELRLVPHDAEARYIRRPDGSPEPGLELPLYGTVDIVLDRVGAVKMGDLGSMDPMRPGVVVLEQRAPQGDSAPEITLRLGSLANQRDVTRFDGGYTALRVTWVADGRFGGIWESGVMGPEAGGHFCAYSK